MDGKDKILVIIEGPDGAGKTTLAKRLEHQFQLKKGERGVDNRDLLWTVTRSDTYKAVQWAIAPDERPRIWDRLFYSEIVYAPLMDRECEFNETEEMFFTRLIEGLQCPVVLCLPPLHEVRQNTSLDHQMEGVAENIDKIHHSYLQMVVDGFFPESTIIYDYTQDRGDTMYNHIAGEVNEYLKERRERMR